MDREDEILEMLKGLADEDIEIPDSLQPERIKEKLLKEDASREIKRRKTMKHWMVGSMAAVGAVAAAFAVMINTGFINPSDMAGNVLTGLPNVVAGNKAGAKKQKKAEKAVEGIKKFKNYKELYTFLAKSSGKRNTYDYLLDSKKSFATEEATDAAPQAKEESGVENDTAKTENDYSKTNTRTEGVDEADIVKTDGKYIYVLKNDNDGASEVRIIKTDNGRMNAITSRISLDREKKGIGYYYNDMMVEGTTLVVFADTYAVEQRAWPLYRDGSNVNTAEVLFYDITNPEKPVLKTKHTQEGSIGSTRMKDGIIYTFSHTYNYNYYYLMDDKEKVDYTKLVPKVDGKKIDIGRIYVPEYSDGESYTVVTSVDVKNPEKIIDKKLIMDSGYNVYVSSENIYFWHTDYIITGNKTEISKYSYKNGIITPQASASVMGTFNDDFSLDEYKGNLRVVVTKEKSSFRIIPFDVADNDEEEDTTENSLYIFDKDLKVKGKIEGLAKGEYIKSARFMGDMAYFVTFRQTDPLFSVDVSNPSAPKVLGYLKIPGFSEYLHPFGSGLLFGLGQDADEKEGGVKGLKLSMFDISNPYDVREIAKTIYSEDKYSSSTAEYDRKAITIDAGKNLIGLAVATYDESKGKSLEKYVVYGFDREKGFYEKFSVDSLEGENYFRSDCRGLYIGDYFYIVPANVNKVYSFDLKSGEEVEKLEY